MRLAGLVAILVMSIHVVLVTSGNFPIVTQQLDLGVIIHFSFVSLHFFTSAYVMNILGADESVLGADGDLSAFTLFILLEGLRLLVDFG